MAPSDVSDGRSADEVIPGQPARDLLDADDFLAFTARLRALRERLDEADISDEQRGRWHSRLLGITDGAKQDLDRASDQLGRFEGELDRILP